MRSVLAALLPVALLLAAVSSVVAPAAQTLALTGGAVFDGERFVERDVYVEGGVFVADRPARLDTVLDVTGGFVVPPYGDFHNHTLDGPWGTAAAARYVREGTLYTLNATATPWGYGQVRETYERPGTLDPAFAIGVTSTYSHPQILIESVFRQFSEYFQRRLSPEQMATVRDDRIAEGRGYWLADDLAALDTVWTQMAAGEPDAIKVYLDDVEAGLVVGDVRGHGLHPDVLADVVRRAHDAGLRVLAHVETAADARIAVESGVDALMHLPGYRILGLSDSSWTAQRANGWARYRLDDATVRRMGERGVIVNPTVWLNVGRAARSYPDRPTRLVEGRRFQFKTLRQLRDAGARVVVGQDGADGTTWDEARYMAEHGLFGPAEMLRTWTTVTPQAIFPDRRIGEVAPGYEASLLVLACDPLADFACTQDIRVRMKDGVLLPEPEVPVGG